MLLLAVHSVEAVTAKVPLVMIMLNEHIKRRTLPEELRVRMVLPTSGLLSSSLWDAPDAITLKIWLEENLGAECQHEVFEVQEEFCYGASTFLGQARAAEKVAEGGKKTLETVGETASSAYQMMGGAAAKAVTSVEKGFAAFDQKTGVLTAASNTTTAALAKVKATSSKVMENERVANLVTGVSTSMRGLGRGVSWLGGQVGKVVTDTVGNRAGSGGTSPRSGNSVTGQAGAADTSPVAAAPKSMTPAWPPPLPYSSKLAPIPDDDASNEDSDCCPTCLEPYTPDNPRKLTACGHSFHLPCILAWGNVRPTCPLCEAVVEWWDEDGTQPEHGLALQGQAHDRAM